MSDAYRTAAEFAQTWGLVYFVAIFLVVVAYAYWPSRKQHFEDAARLPLEED
jgi:cytochrome c oxidase cbb3-type subunit 4